MLIRISAIVLVLMVLFIPVSQAQDNNVFILEGFVRTANNEALSYATVRTRNDRFTITDADGYFELRIPRNQMREQMWLEVRFVGKQTYRADFLIPDGATSYRHDVKLLKQDLYLTEVTVSARQSEENVSNSTYVIDRIAIEQAQAYTLGDLLQIIPGQTITNPMLQGAQSINFRSNLPSQYSNNNAFGIGIFVNDASMNNNANMQGYNPVTNNAFRSFGSTRVSTNTYQTGDSPGGGFDLRELPVGDIERVEVVQGIASARYGDILEGGIFIETVAGRSPWNINVRRAAGNTNLGVNKGIQLHPRHALNVSFDYFNSNADPRDRVKSYNRVTSSLLWTSYLGEQRQIRNTVSVSFRTNLDDFQIDPDFGTEQRVYYQNQTFSISNRLTIQSQSLMFNNMTLSVSANTGRSTSLLDQFVNPGVLPVTDVITEGVHPGTYHPSSYRTERQILGEPLSLSSRVQFNRAIDLGEWTHNVSYGVNASFDGNYGDGRVFDPLRPIRFGGATTNERPISYREMSPESWQSGAFLENSISGEINGRRLTTSLGLRGDLQNGYANVSPRLNTRFNITEAFSITGGYGIQIKAPGLLHLYPGPDYEDYILLNSYNGNVSESVFLSYTRVSTNTSEDLKPMKSRRMEAGFQLVLPAIRLGTTFYRNVTDDGITVLREPSFLDLPVYEIVDRPPGQAPVIEDTGETSRVIYAQGRVANMLYSRNWGVELTASTPRIESIQTSFSLNVSYTNSYYFNRGGNFNFGGRTPQPEEEIWYGIYPPNKSQSGRINALLTSMHHISDLGLLVTLRSEMFIYNYTEVLSNSNRAIAYVNNQLNIVPIDENEINDPRFDVLDRNPVDGSFTRDPSFVYFNFHANVSKNISSAVRLSFFANNFLNIRPEVINSEGNLVRRLNQEPYFGMELRLTL
ncbi:MAG: TonB-dependent receptor [Balneolales bacterium]|nr:TonB-dependent receptor [Balneolales bacterium]